MSRFYGSMCIVLSYRTYFLLNIASTDNTCTTGTSLQQSGVKLLTTLSEFVWVYFNIMHFTYRNNQRIAAQWIL